MGRKRLCCRKVQPIAQALRLQATDPSRHRPQQARMRIRVKHEAENRFSQVQLQWSAATQHIKHFVASIARQTEERPQAPTIKHPHTTHAVPRQVPRRRQVCHAPHGAPIEQASTNIHVKQE